ncbi:monocarboxylate transporter 9-like [Ctenocephalides felis]|nr:monocarboxylate transporter 9-like [Ctenocephalides felis]
MVIGVTFALYSDIAFSAIQTMYLFALGWSKTDTAICVSAAAAADLSSRMFLAGMTACVKVSSRTVFLAGALFSVFARIVFLYVTDFTMMLIISSFLGFFRTWIHVPLPLVFAEYFSQERFPSAYGLFMFLQGIMTLALGPIVGFIRDATHSYIICFHALTVCLLICCIPWLAEMAWLKMKNKK